ncbi:MULTISPECIES: xanthine dehydrogenase family protein molybdopterin-binding subunit [Arthrobacter]|uniref:Xanthine dehydrogenase family protein molybdopterin-binding subunit n=1 Tax=Arthrobacter terricola TaxID=2547396 RepID=A0A4R5KKM8_9MICC|nr:MULTISPECIES: xanthine dehydrogenase family protein molybdopterin-binding subunit [Arthrobacter]MBT8159225.1 xanthine dehydrogenase family protein molybdopterin-binding subunit [Arthrobacter sp. GN70]TDF94940.1 xanthine dehydrogenase family protein molybdopterin-binding subunit [Arthrobacter terricola]
MTVTEVGKARLRKEDAHLITGRTRYTDNLTLPGTLHLALVRSPFAHAKITSIDTSEAKSSPGVVAVLTGADVADKQGSLPNVWPITAEQKAPAHPAIAVDTVAFAGEVVACIVARTAAAARDAVELVDVSYEELPVVLDLEEAVKDEVLAHPDLGTNISATWVYDSGTAGSGKPIAEALEGAEVLIERTYYQQRLIPAFMEPRSVLVDPTGEQLTVWSATQIPHILRLLLALTLGIPESKVRVIAPDVGGGFGGKLQVTPEEAITVLAARHTGKPCKYTETRSESLMAAHHGRAQVQKVKLAATKDGIVTGLDIHLLADMGAYLGLVASGVPILGAFMYNSIYKFPAYRFECTNLFTNKAWTDAYRGAGRPEATFAIERTMDELAVELNMDPLELRKKNWITHEEFPFATVAGLEYDSGNYEAATAKAEELFGYDELRAEQARRREANDPVQLGIGISTYTEMCGLAPSRVLGALRYVAGGWDHAQVRVLPTGNIEVVTGTSAHGQGHETAWSQLVADKLGVAFENIEVLHGDTHISQRGMDTYGSRSLVVGGMAVLAAADKVIAKAKVMAAHMMEASEEDIEFAEGKFSVKGTEQSTSFGDVAFATFAGHDLPEGFEPNLDSEATVDPDNFSFPHGTHFAAIEVDTETGEVSIRKYVCVDDVGVVVNPLIVEGQVHGGLAQGIAQALYEEAVHDETGTLVTGSFVDYLVPSAPDLPHFTTARTETPATTNQLGAKGVGEAGTIASTPAIVNGVLDAVRHLGVKDINMPCSPSRVWAALEEAKTAGGVQ